MVSDHFKELKRYFDTCDAVCDVINCHVHQICHKIGFC